MTLRTHEINNAKIAEVNSENLLISSASDGLELLGNLYYQDFDRIVLREENIAAEFFDLKNGMAGEILQKFSNYRVRLAIVGDFSKYTSKSISDFIRESNKLKQINFVTTTSEALEILSKS